MLIGLDGIPLTEPKTGVGHYTFELGRALAAAAAADKFELVYPSRYPSFALPNDDSFALPENLQATRVSTGALDRQWWSIGLPRYARRRGIELFHGTNYEVPLWGKLATVLTIHDLSAFVHPETQIGRRARRLRRRLPLMAKRATRIITPTEFVREEVCERLKINPDKVSAVAEAPRHTFYPLEFEEARAAAARLGVEVNFLLAVGTIEPRKNLLTLLSAFEELIGDTATPGDLKLVIAGPTGWLHDEFSARVATSPARARVHLAGYLEDEDLRALYSACRVFVYPSLYEGFGLPPLEALACGAPVVASRIPALVETLSESALFFPSTDAPTLAAVISDLLVDAEACHRLREAGLQRAREFSWDRAARLTLEVYEQARASG